jgi:exosortase/archaeosortase family protein
MRLSDNQTEKGKEILLFLLKFNLLAIPMYLIIFSGTNLPFLEKLTTDIVFPLLEHAYPGQIVRPPDANWFFVASGTSIEKIYIDTDCTAWKSMYALAALMMASPLPKGKKKLEDFGIGLLAIFSINIVRIYSTIAFSITFGMQYLDVVHTVLWREGMILAVVGIWALWYWKMRGKSFHEKAKYASGAKEV